MSWHWITAAAGGGSAHFGGGGGGGVHVRPGGGGGWTVGGLAGILLFVLVMVICIGGIVLIAMVTNRRRRARIAPAIAAAAADDEAFAEQAVLARASELYMEIQAAWSARDRDRLRQLVAPDLMIEWERRLDDFAAKGWHNIVKVLRPPNVTYASLHNRAGDADDRVVVNIVASIDDYVETASGERINHNGAGGTTRSVTEFWTLGKRDGEWILASIESGAEGEYHFKEDMVTAPEADPRVHDEAVAELAVADAAPELLDVTFSGDARAAAMDLAMVDGRFSPDLIEVSARRIVEAWERAVDGDDGALEAVAAPAAVTALLYPRDHARLVIRGPQVRAIRITGLAPPTVDVEVDVRGIRYLQDRDTAGVIEGDDAVATGFSERWTLILDGPADWPWRIAGPLDPATWEQWADDHPGPDAVRVYERALDGFSAWAAGATSGGEGIARTQDADRVRDKLDKLHKALWKVELDRRGELLGEAPPYFSQLAGQCCDEYRIRLALYPEDTAASRIRWYWNLLNDADGHFRETAPDETAVIWEIFRNVAFFAATIAAEVDVREGERFPEHRLLGPASAATIRALRRLPAAATAVPRETLEAVRAEVDGTLEAWLRELGFTLPRTPVPAA